MLSGGSIPPSPGTMSSASSIEDVGAMSEEFREFPFILLFVKYIYFLIVLCFLSDFLNQRNEFILGQSGIDLNRKIPQKY